MGMEQSISNLLSDLSEKEVLRIVKDRVGRGGDPVKILEECKAGMEIVGERFNKYEYFIADMLMAAEIFRKVHKEVEPYLKKVPTKTIGRVVLGTVKDDIHDIGKDIVKTLMEVEGFEVFDIGVDVTPERFVEKIIEVKPQIVGLACLLSSAFTSIKRTVQAIEEAGLRNDVKVIVGGAAARAEASRIVEDMGVHVVAETAPKAVSICKQWVGSR